MIPAFKVVGNFTRSFHYHLSHSLVSVYVAINYSRFVTRTLRLCRSSCDGQAFEDLTSHNIRYVTREDEPSATFLVLVISMKAGSIGSTNFGMIQSRIKSGKVLWPMFSKLE